MTCAAAAVLAAAPIAPAAANAQSGAENGQWRYYGGDAGSTRYAPLDQINPDNVTDLEIAWRWQAANFGPQPEFNYRTTPLMVDGVLYATAGYRRTVVAIDAGTGETLWTYRLHEGDRAAPRRNSGRGVAWWESPGVAPRIFLVTPGFQLVALDAATGRPVPDFGDGGVVELRLGLGRELDLIDAPIGSSSPPIVVDDVIVVGSALPSGSAPRSRTMPPGHVRGYDAFTGELRWTFHTIPQPGEFGHETWEDGSWEYTGNAAVWTALSADPELGYVYLPVELGTGDYYGGHRPGDNLFSQSIVALDAETGERVWHFQTVRHGIWDYDPPAAPVLADLVVDGREIPAVALITKQTFTFVFDRQTGEPVWPIEERPVPQTDVPGERTAPTQPFPTKPPPYDRQGVDPADLIDFTPELRAEAEEILSQLHYGPLYEPPTVPVEGGTQGTLMVPGSLGGANWPGGALDPESGYLYVQSATGPSVISLINEPEVSDMDYIRGGGLRLRQGGGPQGLPLFKPPWGRITAIDLNEGEIAWQVPNGDAPDYVKDHPALEGIDVGRTGRPDRGGLLVTRTLLFAGEGGGMFAAFGSGGNRFRAHDKASGEMLAEIELPANQTGLPMTYMHEGRQYIVVAVGARRHPAELVALALPE
ncbi:MAG: pyrroloquinoline quinone-dependent dehydrogenase [Gemmatimonadetes bacterium]|nr:pyrroloquinoline quinone-dependent dehydrogenase [Gemmatimonadota bacterium]MXX73618.1 pyrroloquinoline quinone-dependent dehydrogenase [Gemmatimonadota bacterium]MYC92952.1 pyrroloquinoline quinone-dependent dehydrogenase [Gemmatimonadota bacterium]